ncbi:MAG: hypothetical protein E7231_01955 [Cellulosilyticum sp.]|nr:hypothetical protein [Cellulosilyticum sp.]
MKQRMMVPSYMANFKCIAGECEETCCAGWYIAVDEATYKKYKKVKNPDMKKRLDKELVVKKGNSTECAAKIKLKNNRCAFLDKGNLCDIYKNLGEQYLSETCTMYPRNTNALGEQVELSLALSCPEAARQVLLSKQSISFEMQECSSLPVVGASLKLQLTQPKHFEDYLLKMREVLCDIWQEKCYNIQDKWQAFEQVMMKFHACQSRQDFKKLSLFLKEMQDKGCKEQYLRSPKKSALLEYYTSEEMAKKLLACLTGMRSQKKWPSAIYEACYMSMLEGLGEACDKDQYKKGETIYQSTLLETYPYILENYFVNYIYERLVPINQSSPLESLEEMYLYYALIRLHLIGQAAHKESLVEIDIVKLIQGFTRVFDHNVLYIQQIKKQLAGK